MNVILLSKSNCPQCDRLYKTLEKNPKTKGVLDKIKRVHEIDQAEEYVELTTKHNIMSMPALIVDGMVVPQAKILPELMKVNSL